MPTNLVGIGNSQVPTNAMLGGLAYQDSVGEINIEKIKSRTNYTARDIFVYDTRKDSDGGAWRHRTQGTSWYNEKPSEYRGTRKEFPTVAVIVGIDGGIIIYDGDDPNLPMWMRFKTNETSYAANFMIWGTYHVRMKNGWLYTGSPQGNGYENVITRVNFISEESGLITADGLWYGYKSIADRNTANLPGSSSSTYDTSTLKLLDNSVTALAMTVLKSSPIDVKTGLPNPTVAIQSAKGVTIIKDNDTYNNMQGTVNVGLYRGPSIAFTKDEKLLYNMSNNSANNYSIVMVIPLSVFASNKSKGYEYQFTNEATYSYNVTGSSSIDFSNSYAAYFYDAVETQLGYFSMATNFGLVSIQHVPQDLNDGGRSSLNLLRFSGGMACEITKDYNTGWKLSDPRGVFLSDTDDTNISGGELVTNGTFDSNVNNWTAQSNWGTLSHSSGRLRSTNANNQNGFAIQQVTVIAGRNYVIRADLYKGTNSQVSMQVNSVGGSQSDSTGGVTTDGTYSLQFTPDSNTIQLNMGQGLTGNGKYTEIDNVSVMLGDHDRSRSREYNWRNFGLQAYGTIVKRPVVTGAELVSYGPFTDSNYFRQAYNSDLDFSTNQFSISVWVKPTANTPYMRIVNRVQDTNNRRWELYTDNTVENIVFYTRDGSAASYAATDDHAAPLNTWTHVFAVRERDGDMKVYINGRLEKRENLGGTHNPAVRNLSSTTAELLVGTAVDWDSSKPFTGELTLLRLAASAPTPEQVRKTYDDERKLFAVNAKCTLYGTSDDVKTIAYDDTNDVTYVGTSSGRSDFNGLVRINNTTVGVTSAISASDGFVAEQ